MKEYESTIILKVRVRRATIEAAERRWKIMEDRLKADSAAKVHILLQPNWEEVEEVEDEDNEQSVNS